MIVDGIECRPAESENCRSKKLPSLYATIPLEWLNDLPGESGKVKLIGILWCYSGMAKGEWFPLGNEICRRYRISPSQKSRILKSLEKSGHVELKHKAGKALQVRIVRPINWR
jgi:DNA-binding MarR family transcriptional regulator